MVCRIQHPHPQPKVFRGLGAKFETQSKSKLMFNWFKIETKKIKGFGGCWIQHTKHKFWIYRVFGRIQIRKHLQSKGVRCSRCFTTIKHPQNKCEGVNVHPKETPQNMYLRSDINTIEKPTKKSVGCVSMFRHQMKTLKILFRGRRIQHLRKHKNICRPTSNRKPSKGVGGFSIQHKTFNQIWGFLFWHPSTQPKSKGVIELRHNPRNTLKKGAYKNQHPTKGVGDGGWLLKHPKYLSGKDEGLQNPETLKIKVLNFDVAKYHKTQNFGSSDPYHWKQFGGFDLYASNILNT